MAVPLDKSKKPTRKELGLCCSCGNPPLPGETRCQAHKEAEAIRAKARYLARKEAGVCSQNKAHKALPGMSVCQECLDYHNAKTAAHREENAESHKVYMKARYEELVAAGICPQCTVRPAKSNRIYCEECGRDSVERNAKLEAAWRLTVMTHYGLKCALCDEAEYKFLQIDHAGGDGAAHRKEIGRLKIYKWLIDHDLPPGFRTLCILCNVEHGLTLRHRLTAENLLPIGDILCSQCKDRNARVGRVLCHECALDRQALDKAAHARRRELIFAHYGTTCSCCGTERCLQIDHINGGGNAHRREIGSSGLYRDIIKNNFPAEYQTLCAQCNLAKAQHGECPHETARKAAAATAQEVTDVIA